MQIDLVKSIEILKKDHVVALPTETVYGLAANAYNSDAVSRIYQLKSRPSFNPLIIHYKNYDAILSDVHVADHYAPIIKKMWQSGMPITFVLNAKSSTQVSKIALAGHSTIACRIPHHPVFMAVLEQLDFPLAAPSANRSNHISPTKLSHVEQSLGPDVPVLEGNQSQHGVESTIIDLTSDQPAVLRYGAASIEDIQKFLPVSENLSQKTASAGQLKKHYSPNKKVRLNATELKNGEVLLAFGDVTLPHIYNLSQQGDLREATANLFDMMYALESGDHHTIAISPIPNEGLGRAINDRITRSANQT